MKLILSKFKLTNRSLAGLLLVLAIILFSSCARIPSPTGSAVGLSATRFDYAAQREADETLDGASSYRDIDIYLEEASRVPSDWVRTGAPRLDRLSREVSTFLRRIVGLVKSYQQELETYKDTASFLNANSEKSARELVLVMEQHDTDPNRTPIRPTINAFYDSQQEIFQSSESAYRAMLTIIPILSDPSLPVRKSETSAVKGIGKVLGFLIENGFLKTKGGCSDPRDKMARKYGAKECNGMIRLCPEDGQCFRRPVEEHQALVDKALDRIDIQMQALINGNRHIAHIQQRLMLVAWGFGIDFADASEKTDGSYEKVESLSSIIQGANVFPIRSIDTVEECERVWRAALTTLSEQDERLIIGGWRPGAIVSDVTRHGWYGTPEYTRYFIVFERLRGESQCRMSYRIMLYYRKYYRSGRYLSFSDVFAGKDKLVLETHPMSITSRYDGLMDNVMNELDANK